MTTLSSTDAALPLHGSGEPLLRIRDLRLSFVRDDGSATVALHGIDLDVAAGEALGVVGETGCGKTVTGLAAMRLLPENARVSAERMTFDGRDLLAATPAELRAIRGSGLAMIFQNPSGAFNPVFTIGSQMAGVLAAHKAASGKAASGKGAQARIREVLAEVGMPDVERVMRAYPHQLSGGMLQRAMIATALLCHPRLIIADEPTTALDVTIAAQILQLLRRLQQEEGFSMLLITHDLGVVRAVCDRVAVLYAGRVVETASTGELFRAPQHPYTRGLLAAVPRAAASTGALRTIPGSVPHDVAGMGGCAFAPRCPIVHDRCHNERPQLVSIEYGHLAACHFPGVTEPAAASATPASAPETVES
jgi:peptide/nickel transport system ATP-binding protein